MNTRILFSLLAMTCTGMAMAAAQTADARATEPAQLTSSGSKEAGVDWPGWRGPNHDGSTSEPISTNWPKEGPPKLWEKKIGHGFSCVIVSGNRMITLGADASKENAICLDAATGAVLWETLIDDKPMKWSRSQSSPVTDGKVVVAISVNGNMVAMDIASGKILWSKSLFVEMQLKQADYGWASSPLLHKNMAIINNGLAFNLTTGEIAWENSALRNNPEISKIYSTPVPVKLEGKTGVLIRAGKALTCIDPDTGVEIWNVPGIVSTSNTDPVVSGDLILCSECYCTKIIKFTSKSAEIVSTFPLRMYLQDGLAYKNHVYINPLCTGNMDSPPLQKNWNALACIDPLEVIASGKYNIWDKDPSKKIFPRKWQQPGAEGSIAWGAMIVAADNIVFVTKDSWLVVLRASAEKYEQLAAARLFDIKYEKHKGVWAVPVISHGNLYCRAFRENDKGGDFLACYDVRPK